MEDSDVILPKKLITNLLDIILPPGTKGDEKFALIIRLETKNISLRELAAYLNFIDKAFGRLTPAGIYSYSKTSKYELKITEISHGSLEIIISNLLSDLVSSKALIVVGLLLKYLPGIIRSALSGYRDYEEGRLARVQRQQIKEQITQDKKLSSLAKRQIKQLIELLTTLYRMDTRNLPKAHKFSKETVIQVELKLQPSNKTLNKVSSEEKQVRKIRILRKSDVQ
jgi:hypothetical protein